MMIACSHDYSFADLIGAVIILSMLWMSEICLIGRATKYNLLCWQKYNKYILLQAQIQIICHMAHLRL